MVDWCVSLSLPRSAAFHSARMRACVHVWLESSAHNRHPWCSCGVCMCVCAVGGFTMVSDAVVIANHTIGVKYARSKELLLRWWVKNLCMFVPPCLVTFWCVASTAVHAQHRSSCGGPRLSLLRLLLRRLESYPFAVVVDWLPSLITAACFGTGVSRLQSRTQCFERILDSSQRRAGR